MRPKSRLCLRKCIFKWQYDDIYLQPFDVDSLLATQRWVTWERWGEIRTLKETLGEWSTKRRSWNRWAMMRARVLGGTPPEPGELCVCVLERERNKDGWEEEMICWQAYFGEHLIIIQSSGSQVRLSDDVTWLQHRQHPTSVWHQHRPHISGVVLQVSCK